MDVNNIYQYWGCDIELDELSVPCVDIGDTNNATDAVSLEVPVIRINDKILSAFEIISLYIDCTEFIPKIELKAIFTYERFLLLDQVKDGDLLSIAIRPQNNNLKIIRNDYIITNAIVSERYNSSENNISPYMITFIGELFIPKMYLSGLDLSFCGTTFESMQNYAKVLGLGFATNDDSTNDKQNWLSYNITPREYIENVVKHSWKDNNSFYHVWIDVYYNLNFINVNKQLMMDESELEYGALLNNIDSNFIYGSNVKKDNTVIFPKFLSNAEFLIGTSSFINSWHSENKSSYVTSSIGTVMSCNIYEHNNINYENGDKLYWSLDIEPVYDTSKLDSHIILRGRCTYDSSVNVGELARANYKATDIFRKNRWMGVQYTCSNTSEDSSKWNGNQHMNYNRAFVHNEMNNRELDKLNLYVTVSGINSNMIRGGKIPIMLLNKSLDMPNESMGETKISSVDRFHSGWFYIKGFNISWFNDEKITSRYTQTIILTRREWETPIEVTPIKTK